jgi:guanyl-specific ribonuclease Sa
MSDVREHKAQSEAARPSVRSGTALHTPDETALEDALASRFATTYFASAEAPPPASVAQRMVSRLQRQAGNRAVARLATSSPAIQRAVYKEGGKGAVAVPQSAKTIKTWVSKPSVQAGGRNHIADVQGRGFPGFKKGKDEYAGGRTFNNGAQPDGNKLPYTGGQTYQEWDIIPCVVGQNRGAERIITSSDGKAYYTNDHYANFTEF